MDLSHGDNFNRPPRIQVAQVVGQIDIPPAPTKSEDTARTLLLSLLPMMGLFVMSGFYLFIGMNSGTGVRGALFAIPMVAMGLVSVLAGILTYSQGRREQRERRIKQQRDYHQLLDRRQARLQAARDLQLTINARNFPAPSVYLEYIAAQDVVLWNRRPEDSDFATLRLGMGTVPSTVTIDDSPDVDAIAEGSRRALDLVFEYRKVPHTCITLNLLQSGSVGIAGSRAVSLSFVYALITQLVACHAPTDLTIYLFSTPTAHPAWNWLRWLPHTSSEQIGGNSDLLAFRDEHARQLLSNLGQRISNREERARAKEAANLITDRSLIVAIFDNLTPVRDEMAFSTVLRSRSLGVVGICLADHAADISGDCGATITLADDGRFTVGLTGPAGLTIRGIYDRVSRAQVDMAARHLTNLTLPNAGESTRIPTDVDFLQMYNVNSIGELNILQRWQRIPDPAGTLPFPVPVGNTTFSTQLRLHLITDADGFHGVIAGTTGSGKSELLQTLITSLALEHHPYLVNFLLIDFKGGSTVSAFRNLPHTVGVATDLNTSETLRMLEAINSELVRRKEFLHHHGDLKDITSYHQLLSRAGTISANWEPLPHLFVIIDEFAELIDQIADFRERLNSIGRIGRSLGVHLLLATQRPANNVSEEMRANLQLRICLRVQSADDSRDMLLRPDAAYLSPRVPGRAYFQVGNSGQPQQFQVARVSTVYSPDREQAAMNQPFSVKLIRYEEVIDLRKEYEETVRRAAQHHDGDETEDETQPGTLALQEVSPPDPLMIDRLVERMCDVFDKTPFHHPGKILLDSLKPEIPLETILQAHEYGGWNGTTWGQPGRERTWASAPIGLIDDLSNRSQPPLMADLHGKGGHLLAVGGPGTGKTVLLRTVAISFARLFTPDEVQMYFLSFAGRGLDMFLELPHVGAVIHNDEAELVGRLIQYLQQQLAERRDAFFRARADNLLQYNQALHSGQTLRDASLKSYPALIVLVDNFVELLQSFADEVGEVVSLIRDGRAYGIHFVITASEPGRIPYQVLNLIEGRLALRLTDRTDYALVVGLPDREIDAVPGRALLRDRPPLHCQIALPTAGDTDPERAREIGDLIAKMRAAWGQRPAAYPILNLPENVPLDGTDGLLALLPPTAAEGGYPSPVTLIARDGTTLEPVQLDWARTGPHFLINGPVGTGKSSLLFTLLLGAAAAYPPEQLHMLIVDFRNRGLRPLRHLPHVIAYVTDENNLFNHLRRFVAELRWRRDQVQQQLGESDGDDTNVHQTFRSVVIAVDDYDRLSNALSSQANMLEQLALIMRRDTQLNFYVLVAAETASLTRADRLIQQLKLARSGFALVSCDAVEQLGGRVTNAMRRETLPDGRGYLLTRSSMNLMQFAHSIEPQTTIRDVIKRWEKSPRAAWEIHAEQPPDTIEAGEPSQDAAPGELTFESSDFDFSGALGDYMAQQGYKSAPDMAKSDGDKQT